jgi:hypothetical protein
MPRTQRRSGLRRARQWHLGVVHVQGSNYNGTVLSGELSLNVPAFISMKDRDAVEETRSFRRVATALLCRLIRSAWIYG